MKTYKLIFTTNQIVSELPNSQTIFGAICNIIKITNGEDELEKFIESFDDVPYFVHSSMFVNNYLPMVKKSVYTIEEVNKEILSVEGNEKIERFNHLKKLKKISYMSEDIYFYYIKKENLDNLFDKLKSGDINYENGYISYEKDNMNKHKSELLTRNCRDDQSLFYNNVTYYDESTEFCIYIKTDKDINKIIELFKLLEFTGIGSRKSVGRNCFEYKRFEEINESKTDCKEKMILSRYIPSKGEVDFGKSNYQITTNTYRRVNQYFTEDIVGDFTHVLEGSYMHMNDEKEYYGSLIKIEFDDNDIYHYGIGFVL